MDDEQIIVLLQIELTEAYSDIELLNKLTGDLEEENEDLIEANEKLGLENQRLMDDRNGLEIEAADFLGALARIATAKSLAEAQAIAGAFLFDEEAA